MLVVVVHTTFRRIFSEINLTFLDKMGPSRAEMAAKVEDLFIKYDTDHTETLSQDEFTNLLADLDESTAAGAVRRKLFGSKVFWASILVVIASFCACLSAILQSLMGGVKIYTEDNGVFPFAVNRAAWKCMDYPKVRLCRRSCMDYPKVRLRRQSCRLGMHGLSEGIG